MFRLAIRLQYGDGTARAGAAHVTGDTDDDNIIGAVIVIIKYLKPVKLEPRI